MNKKRLMVLVFTKKPFFAVPINALSSAITFRAITLRFNEGYREPQSCSIFVELAARIK